MQSTISVALQITDALANDVIDTARGEKSFMSQIPSWRDT